MTGIKIQPIDHPSRPHLHAVERQQLERYVNEVGLKAAAQGLLESAKSQPSQGSFAGWLWAMGELMMTLADNPCRFNNGATDV